MKLLFGYLNKVHHTGGPVASCLAYTEQSKKKIRRRSRMNERTDDGRTIELVPGTQQTAISSIPQSVATWTSDEDAGDDGATTSKRSNNAARKKRKQKEAPPVV